MVSQYICSPEKTEELLGKQERKSDETDILLTDYYYNNYIYEESVAHGYFYGDDWFFVEYIDTTSKGSWVLPYIYIDMDINTLRTRLTEQDFYVHHNAELNKVNMSGFQYELKYGCPDGRNIYAYIETANVDSVETVKRIKILSEPMS